MLASSRQSQRERRGIILVLVLGMLALMALIGITFATFSGQSRISARNYMQSMNQPQRDELMDYALSQLICDTPDVRSAIRGHSLARDMYGNDANHNGYLAARPDGAYMPPNGDPYFYITGVAQVGTSTQYNLTTNIPANDPAFYGYNFTRWNLRVSYQAVGVSGVVDQTFEILQDSQFIANNNGYRTFTVNIGLTEGNSVAATVGPPPTSGTPATKLINPTLGTTTTLPGQSIIAATGVPRFILDGRWLHAFNGPGMGPSTSPTSPIPGTSMSVYGNFRFNAAMGVNGPNSVGMDEDYDAVDLENWFLAMQSADGSVMIPSFHRPAAIRNDSTLATYPTAIYDWGGPQNAAFEKNGPTNWADSASRILRPRAADGHDAATFPDLVPDPTTHQITYDVDNDGDGKPDSVWLDLGYPARRNAQGQLYKPLFAFMVIGLNGRIPLNTAGNLAGTAAGITYTAGATPYTYGNGPSHAAHLGNSVSEVDPTYALQNAFDPNYDLAPFWAPGVGIAYNTQVDNASVDVRLTQLRNLLAGTRPPQKDSFGTGTDGDTNYVYMETSSGSATLVTPAPAMPNSVADYQDTSPGTDANGHPYVLRLTPPVAGRWGEASSIPGGVIDNSGSVTSPPAVVYNGSNYLNVVQVNYTDPVRAGYSYDITDVISGNTTNNYFDSGSTMGWPRDAADDNYNAFDPFPLGHTGEVNDSDSYDLAGALILPVDRMRRYVNPGDINGTGKVQPWASGTNSASKSVTAGATGGLTAAGADSFGRVLHYSYFRPPGTPGSIATAPTTPYGTAPPTTVGTIGAIYYPLPFGAAGTNYFYTQGPNNNPNNLAPTATLVPYLPDVTNNPLHAFEFFKLPPITTTPGTTAPTGHLPAPNFAFQFQAQRNPAMPLDQTTDSATGKTGFPISFPTYDFHVNSNQHTDGLNDADEMNLYTPNSQIDAAFGAGDLEWLYRQQDVDGSSLTSRLQYLAPVSFTNNLDGQRRRRLFSLDTWEMNNFVWTNDNPGNVFPYNTSLPSFTGTITAGSNSVANVSNTTGLFPGQTVGGTSIPPGNPSGIPIGTTITSVDPGTVTLSANATQTGTELVNVLNLNASFPQLSVNQNTTLPTPPLAHRDKKINLNYPLPVSNDPNEPIRQKWINDAYQLMKAILPPKAVDTPDELAALSQFLVNVIDFRDPDATMTHFRNPDVKLVLGSIVGTTYTSSYLAPYNTNVPAGYTAIPLDQYGMEYNPVAINEAMAYTYPTTSTSTNRFFVELVNTLTQSAISLLPANDFGAGITNPPDPSVLDLSLANYDMVITADDPVSRPDPFTGQLLPIFSAKYLAQLPLNQASVAGAGALFTAPGDVSLTPVYAVNPPAYPPGSGDYKGGYFYVIGSQPGTVVETTPPTPTAQLSSAYDPMNTTTAVPALPANVVPPGYIQNLASVPNTGQVAQTVTTPSGTTLPTSKITAITPGSGAMQYYWLCLRRPANPFAPPQPNIAAVDGNGHSTYNPMVVVDAMRFPYTDGGVTGPPPSPLPETANTIISCQRCQPFRGGHAVRLPVDTLTTGAAPLYTPYGYSEQMAAPLTFSTVGTYDGAKVITKAMYHTLGGVNDQAEPWDYFPFNDRDFTSVAELMLVPGCPPGLFTKQFVELAPMPPATGTTGALTSAAAATTFPVPSQMPPNPTYGAPTAFTTAPTSPDVAVAFQKPTGGSTGSAVQPRNFPYLVDKFFYSGYGGPVAPATLPAADPGNVVDGPGADGWFKMFEFFEVPSQSFGSIGPVAQGTDFDWARQDTKPGLLNLNLIIDEEVFFSVLGSQSVNLNNTGTDAYTQLLLNFAQLPVASTIPSVVTQSLASGAPNYSVPLWGFGGSHPATVAYDPVSGGFFNGMKAAFAQFLALRHWNSQSSATSLPIFTANAERPFHSLSYPDINYTVMRPANLPPATTTYTGATAGYSSGTYTGDPGVRNPYINPASPTSGLLTGIGYGPYAPPIPSPAGPTTASPYGTYFNAAGVTTYVTMPTPVPARRCSRSQIPTERPRLPYPQSLRRPPRATPATLAIRSSMWSVTSPTMRRRIWHWARWRRWVRRRLT